MVDRVTGYFGSKWATGAYQAIISQMPPHDTYIESHLGGGAVMQAKPAAVRSIGIDLDPKPLEDFQQPYPVELIQGDCCSIIDGLDYAGLGRVLIYADPPYVLSTRTSSKRYRCDYTEADHVRLLECLKRVPASVILSGYPSQLYDDLLPDWRTLEFQVMTRGGPRTEKLWMNFEADAVHWSSYAGVDFTDRQRIKRKAERWAANFRDLPAGERTAVLAALLKEMAQDPA